MAIRQVPNHGLRRRRIHPTRRRGSGACGEHPQHTRGRCGSACAGRGWSRARGGGRRSRRPVRSMPRPKPACGTDAVAAQVEVPARRPPRAARARGCAAPSSAEVVLALAAADDLAVALGREHVRRRARARAARDRASCRRPSPRPGSGGRCTGRSNCLGEHGLLVAAEVVAPLRVCEPFAWRSSTRLVVADAREGRLRRSRAWRRRARGRFSSARRVLEHALDDATRQSSARSMSSSRSAKATSGSTIQNSVRWRRVLDFSARNVGPKQ